MPCEPDEEEFLAQEEEEDESAERTSSCTGSSSTSCKGPEVQEECSMKDSMTEDGSFIRYFGFGAMVNPISRQRRKLFPQICLAARLTHYRLDFSSGIGNIEYTANPKDEVHGVVMNLTADEWESVKHFETGYSVVEVTVILYPTTAASDNTLAARCFQLRQEKDSNCLSANDLSSKLPQARYLKIIKQGLEHHSIDPTYIQQHIDFVPCIPTRTPDQYKTFSLIVKDESLLPAISREDYLSMAQGKQDKRTKPVFVMGVFVCQVSLPDSFDRNNSSYFTWFAEHLYGKPDCTWKLMETLYDPDLPPCLSPSETTDLHRRWAMDQAVHLFEAMHPEVQVQVIGTIGAEPMKK